MAFKADSARLAEIKKAERAVASRRRVVLHAGLGAAAGARIAAHFLSWFHARRGLTVAGYWPLRSEADPRPLMARLAAVGCRLALPEVREPARPLVFRLWRFGAPLVEGPHGTLHPAGGAARVIPDVVLVPLLAFDATGTRLGYGGGYFDRTLAALRRRGAVLAVGIAFSGQEAPKLARGRHDQRLDAVVTEAGWRTFPRGRA